MGDIGASVIARLKEKAKKEGLQLQLLINLFCQEEFLRRIQKSKYNENLVLKGGFLLYSISEYGSRPTMDADYMLKNHSNDMVDVEKMVSEIICISSENDFIRFEILGLEPIAEQREYNGIRVNLMGYIKNTKTPFSIDFGVGDVVVPAPSKRLLPVLLMGFEKPEVLTYSLESTIAEKFDAIISRMELTGRMKDFFDIYYLASTCDFEGRRLQEAIFETLQNRGTPYEKDSLVQIAELSNNNDIIVRWDSFCKKSLNLGLDFKEVLDLVIRFLKPVYEAILEEKECFHVWISKEKRWNNINV